MFIITATHCTYRGLSRNSDLIHQEDRLKKTEAYLTRKADKLYVGSMLSCDYFKKLNSAHFGYSCVRNKK